MKIFYKSREEFGSVFVGLIFLILFVHSSYGLQCWVCDTDHDPNCADPLNKELVPLRDCELFGPPSTGNVRVCSRVVEMRNRKNATRRGCSEVPDVTENGYPQFDTRCESKANSNGESSTGCWCKTSDGCNAFLADPQKDNGKGNENSGCTLFSSKIKTIALLLVLLATFLV